MKNCFLLLVSLLFLNLPDVIAQVDYSKPEVVAEKFLELYYSGDWYNASKVCGNGDCEAQITYMVMKMETDEKYVNEGKCEFKIDTCSIDVKKETATCFFTKTCSELKKPKASHIKLIKVGEKWLIDYLWRRDKFF